MPDPVLFAAVLAAGSSTRFGSPKQLARSDGQALVAAAMRRAEAVCGRRTVLVTGFAAERVRAACAPLAGFFVHNENHASGMASSLAAATRACAAVADGLLVTLADQPRITTEDLERLAACWRGAPGRPVASHYAGTTGVPAILPASMFSALLELQGDQGARAVLAARDDEVLKVECAAAAIDIDRPEDLAALGKRRR